MKKAGLLAILALTLIFSFSLAGCRSVQPRMKSLADQEAANPDKTPERSLEEKLADLKIEDIKVGKGATAEEGMAVYVNYVGTLEDGTEFDSNQSKDKPLSFILGLSQVIEGWDHGIAGMKVGGTRKLTIPADLAYGDEGTPDGKIPPNSTLIFEITLLKTHDLIPE